MGSCVSWHIQNGHHGLQVEMGRFALARAVRSETPIRTGYRCTFCSRLEAPAPAPVHTSTHIDPQGRRDQEDGHQRLGVGMSYTSIYASYTPQTEC